jgi:hypothetical protein
LPAIVAKPVVASGTDDVAALAVVKDRLDGRTQGRSRFVFSQKIRGPATFDFATKSFGSGRERPW